MFSFGGGFFRGFEGPQVLAAHVGLYGLRESLFKARCHSFNGQAEA